jgi:hypothetical protein
MPRLTARSLSALVTVLAAASPALAQPASPVPVAVPTFNPAQLFAAPVHPQSIPTSGGSVVIIVLPAHPGAAPVAPARPLAVPVAPAAPLAAPVPAAPVGDPSRAQAEQMLAMSKTLEALTRVLTQTEQRLQRLEDRLAELERRTARPAPAPVPLPSP